MNDQELLEHKKNFRYYLENLEKLIEKVSIDGMKTDFLIFSSYYSNESKKERKRMFFAEELFFVKQIEDLLYFSFAFFGMKGAKNLF